MSSRQHAQQAARALWEKFEPPITSLSTVACHAVYERFVDARADIIDRHIAAALAEQRDELFEYAASNLWHGVQRKLSSPRRSERMLDRAAAVKWLRGQKVALPAPPAKGFDLRAALAKHGGVLTFEQLNDLLRRIRRENVGDISPEIKIVDLLRLGLDHSWITEDDEGLFHLAPAPPAKEEK